jgi:hypothetical protein
MKSIKYTKRQKKKKKKREKKKETNSKGADAALPMQKAYEMG